MIIIATDDEKDELYQSCAGDCDSCLFSYFSATKTCSIDNRKIVVAYIDEADTFTNQLMEEENND